MIHFTLTVALAGRRVRHMHQIRPLAGADGRVVGHKRWRNEPKDQNEGCKSSQLNMRLSKAFTRKCEIGGSEVRHDKVPFKWVRF